MKPLTLKRSRAFAAPIRYRPTGPADVSAAYAFGRLLGQWIKLRNSLAIPGEGSVHVRMDEIPTITIYTRGHPLEAMILGMQDLTIEQVDEALELYAQKHYTVVGTVLGVTTDAAVFTPVTDWSRDTNPEPADIHFIPWEEIRTLLGI